MSLEGRVALVTGGSRGIGRATALALAEDGADVAIHFNRDEASAKETADAVRAFGRRAMTVSAAIQDNDSLAAMAEEVQGELGAVGILINNAGVASQGRSVLKTDAAELDKLMRIHALGPHELCKLVLPGMREQERGDIVMVSSMATKYNAAGGGPYNMGKAAMEALALTLAAEERRHAGHRRIQDLKPGVENPNRRPLHQRPQALLFPQDRLGAGPKASVVQKGDCRVKMPLVETGTPKLHPTPPQGVLS